MGLTAAGLPASLQIIGKAFDEAGVLRIGWAYEQVAGFADLHPDMAPLL
jgi:aspartyl-tRNA(Asn)/glutamyl-tRNA(Gln) amidotransferase subunit A